MTAQPKVDWNLVREDWESGVVSFTDLAEAYGVDSEEIKARCEREGWPKLNADVLTLGLRGRTVTERILGISSTRFYDLESEGVIKPVRDGKFNLLPTIRAAVRYYAMAAAGRTPGKLEQLKIETEQEKVLALRQKRQKEAEKLIPAKEVESALKRIFRYIHDEFTDRSAKLAYTLADEHDPGRIKMALERHDRESVERVADLIRNALHDPLRAVKSVADAADSSVGVGDPVSKVTPVKRGKGRVQP